MRDKTWTANHISKKTIYIAYDEAGQALSCHHTYEEAEEALIKYANFLEKGHEHETPIQT